MLRPAYPIETERLLLRPFEDDDLDALVVKGEWTDELVYAMLAREWTALTSPTAAPR
jgi:RimJ/RimL family protein N-acetyltransferase